MSKVKEIWQCEMMEVDPGDFFEDKLLQNGRFSHINLHFHDKVVAIWTMISWGQECLGYLWNTTYSDVICFCGLSNMAGWEPYWVLPNWGHVHMKSPASWAFVRYAHKQDLSLALQGLLSDTRCSSGTPKVPPIGHLHPSALGITWPSIARNGPGTLAHTLEAKNNKMESNQIMAFPLW